MISILDHIEYLMTEHDCVIVPGLGAFISQYSVSKNAETGIVESVKRNIAFNRSVDYNDGLLINSLMRRENISFERAKSEIDNYVRALYGQLKYEGEVPVGRLGFFSNYNGESLEFFPFASRKANNEYFGLMSLSLKPLAQTIQEEVKQDTSRKQSNVVVLTRRMMQVAASIVLLITMTLVLSTPIIEDNSQNYANFNAFSIKTDVEDVQTRDLYISMPVEKVTEKVEEEEVLIIEPTGNYCLVVASLATEKQLELYVSKYPSDDYSVTKSSTYYRIYVARGTFEEMTKLKREKYADTDAWVARI